MDPCCPRIPGSPTASSPSPSSVATGRRPTWSHSTTSWSLPPRHAPARSPCVAECRTTQPGSHTRMRLAWTGTIAALLLLIALPGTAEAAPACGEPPAIVGANTVRPPCARVAPPPPRSGTRVFGEGGPDIIFGGRGNDRLNGGEGNDRLYGGIGDDQLRGGNGDDRLSGGFGADSALDGEAGNDFVRGDATIDDIQNTGGGIDTLSYATGVTPGFFNRPNSPYFFPDFSVYEDFPETVDGRGAYVNLQTGRGDNGLAPHGGGFDEGGEGASFEIVIGTAFPDYIVGTSAAQTIYGGGGADGILGEGGAGQRRGGPGGGGGGQPCSAGRGPPTGGAAAPRATAVPGQARRSSARRAPRMWI